MPKIVWLDTSEYFYRSSEGEYDEDISPELRRGKHIYEVVDDESDYFHVTNERNGMIHLAGKYGNLGWVYPSAVIKWKIV